MDFERKDGGPPPAHSNYDPSYVAAFYDRDPESEWLRLVRSPLEEIKLHIHEHYLRKYMTSEIRVLEIGAGPGRFTKTLHELGCSVVVGDISAKQLEANMENACQWPFEIPLFWPRKILTADTEHPPGTLPAVVAR